MLSRFGSGQWTWVASGIRWAADNGAHVISMSLGGGNPGNLVEDPINYAYTQKNVLVVAAAGNSYCFGGDTVIWPAQFQNVIAVSALSSATSTAGFSSCGPKVEISAPGQGIVSTMVPGSFLGSFYCGGSSYCSLDGTSMATPHASGVAALAKAQFPAMLNTELRCLLSLTADDIGPSGRDIYTGNGRLDAQGLVTQVAALNALPLGLGHTLQQLQCQLDPPY